MYKDISYINKYGKTLFDKSIDVSKSMKKNMVKKY